MLGIYVWNVGLTQQHRYEYVNRRYKSILCGAYVQCTRTLSLIFPQLPLTRSKACTAFTIHNMILASKWINPLKMHIHPSIHLLKWVLQIIQKRYCCRTHNRLTLGGLTHFCAAQMSFHCMVHSSALLTNRAFDGDGDGRLRCRMKSTFFNKSLMVLYDDGSTVNVSHQFTPFLTCIRSVHLTIWLTRKSFRFLNCKLEITVRRLAGITSNSNNF